MGLDTAPTVGIQTLNLSLYLSMHVYVTSFSSISYYRNVRLIFKMYSEQNSHSITLDIHASTVERPPHLFLLKLHSANKLLRYVFR